MPKYDGQWMIFYRGYHKRLYTHRTSVTQTKTVTQTNPHGSPLFGMAWFCIPYNIVTKLQHLIFLSAMSHAALDSMPLKIFSENSLKNFVPFMRVRIKTGLKALLFA